MIPVLVAQADRVGADRVTRAPVNGAQQATAEAVAPVAAPQGRPLGGWRSVAAVVLAVGAAGIGLLGFVVSFSAVRAAVAPSFGELAWTVPVGIDVGIFVFTGIDLLYTLLGCRMRHLRLLPWGLVAATVYLNVAASASSGDVVGGVAHGVLPGLWVAVVEVGTHPLRWWAGLVDPSGADEARRMDRVRFSRWLLAPISTLRIRRLMVLWEERSYQVALDRWQARHRALAHMAKRHGRIKWRWKAPIDQRLDYRYAQLSLSKVADRCDGLDGASPTSSSDGVRAPGGGPVRSRRQGTHTSTSATAGRAVAHAGTGDVVARLLPEARVVAGEVAGRGVKLTRDSLREAYKERGGLSNRNAGLLVAALRAEGCR